MWRKSAATFAALCLVVGLGFSLTRCGGTGSDLEGFPEGVQFVDTACLGSSCLIIRITPRTLPADGFSEASIEATLRNADGAPVAGEEICFALEDPNVATIVEPTGAGCQITNSLGTVSGRVRAGTLEASVFVLARSFVRNLEARGRLVLGDPGQVPTGLAVQAVPATIFAGSSSSPPQTSVVSARLTDQSGTPITGATITFNRNPTVGSLSSSTAITGADGVANVIFTAGSSAANVSIEARTDDGQSGAATITILGFAAFCGDGIRQPSEECDDGNRNSCDGCSDACVLEITAPICGNGVLECGEECDDLNIVEGDGCSAMCEQTTQCSDGIDNDSDGLIDAGDPDCSGPGDNTE